MNNSRPKVGCPPLFWPVGSMPGLTEPPAACEWVSAAFGAPDAFRAVLPPAAMPLQHKLPTVSNDTKPLLQCSSMLMAQRAAQCPVQPANRCCMLHNSVSLNNLNTIRQAKLNARMAQVGLQSKWAEQVRTLWSHKLPGRCFLCSC